MLSVVSRNDTPVLPFVAQPERITPEIDAQRIVDQLQGYELPRFFNGETGSSVRLAVALTSALMVARKHPRGVVILAPSQSLLSHGEYMTEAFERAVQVARTGKIVELATSAPADTTSAAAIRGIAGGYHLGEFIDQASDQYEGTGIFALRADSFLTEAEILCGTSLSLCRESLIHGQVSSKVTDGALDDLATLSFWDGFWTRTDNRAALVIGEQTEPKPVHIPARAQPLTQRSLVG